MVQHPRQPNAPAGARQVNARKAEEGGGERVAKALARAGVASRREVERLIEAGRVALNGQVLDTPAVKISPGDVLTVDGKVIDEAEPTRLWRYHKPAGLVTTHRDPEGRPTVFERLPSGMPRVISVGRLDLNSEGLLLLTNDGGLARALELPANAWIRRYRARAFGHTSQAKLDTLMQGITVDGIAYGPMEAHLDKVQSRGGEGGEAPANVWISIAITEGKNREVRRVLEAIGLKVNRLIRLAYGPFALGTLEVGAVEEVGPRVIREQLTQFIDPANLPKGDRRTGVVRAAPEARRNPRPPLGARDSAEPGASPRPFAKGAARQDEPAAEETREKKTYKAGWAKAKVKVRAYEPPAKPGRPHAGARPGTPMRADAAPGGARTEAEPARTRSEAKPGGKTGGYARREAGPDRADRSEAKPAWTARSEARPGAKSGGYARRETGPDQKTDRSEAKPAWTRSEANPRGKTGGYARREAGSDRADRSEAKPSAKADAREAKPGRAARSGAKAGAPAARSGWAGRIHAKGGAPARSDAKPDRGGRPGAKPARGPKPPHGGPRPPKAR